MIIILIVMSELVGLFITSFILLKSGTSVQRIIVIDFIAIVILSVVTIWTIKYLKKAD